MLILTYLQLHQVIAPYLKEKQNCPVKYVKMSWMMSKTLDGIIERETNTWTCAKTASYSFHALLPRAHFSLSLFSSFELLHSKLSSSQMSQLRCKLAEFHRSLFPFDLQGSAEVRLWQSESTGQQKTWKPPSTTGETNGETVVASEKQFSFELIWKMFCQDHFFISYNTVGQKWTVLFITCIYFILAI